MSAKRVLFYVQHLLGIGHLRRAATLTRAMVEAGLEVTVVSGGHEIPGIDLGGAELVQLPATRATDLYFKVLVDEDGEVIDEGWKERRAEMLLETWRARAPHVLMFELFPFGRRQMRFELLPLLDAAKASDRSPVIVSSVRDILVAQKKPERNDEMLERARKYFDHVMIHGDPTLVPFEMTFPHAERIRDLVDYTGYVVDKSGTRGGPGSPGHDEVIVSSGGGAVGHDLLKAAIGARALGAAAARDWRVLVGVTVEDEKFGELTDLAAEAKTSRPSGRPGGRIVVERARPDFTTLLMNCALSISQGGYNTVMELLHAQCRAIVVPYAGGIETEQTLRARLLAERGVLNRLDEKGLTAEQLADAVERALQGPPARTDVDVSGAATGAALVKSWAMDVPW